MTTSTGKDRVLRIAYVGVGAGVFGAHQPALSSGHFQVVAATDQAVDRGQARAAELGCPFFDDHHALLAATEPEVVVVLTPHPFHAPIAIDCMKAGAHVLVEKPMAVQIAEADAMLTTAAATQRLLAVNFQQRYRPEVRAAWQLINDGRLGQLQAMNFVVLWPRSRAYFGLAPWRGTWRGEGGGVLMNQAVHNLDLICHLMGMPGRLVGWTATRLQTIEAEDTAQAMLEWPNGAVGSFHTSTAESGQPERLEIWGTAGRLEVTQGGLRFQQFDEDLTTFIPNTAEIWNGPKQHDVDVALPATQGDHAAIYANLYRALVHGEPLMADGGAARQSLELANAIIYSSHTRREVELPLDPSAYAQLLQELQQ